MVERPVDRGGTHRVKLLGLSQRFGRVLSRRGT